MADQVDRVRELAGLIVARAQEQLDMLPQPQPVPCADCPGGRRLPEHMAIDHASVAVPAGLLWRLREALR